MSVHDVPTPKFQGTLNYRATSTHLMAQIGLTWCLKFTSLISYWAYASSDVLGRENESGGMFNLIS